MTKIEKEMRKREADAIRAVNKAADDYQDVYEGAMRVLWNMALLITGIVIGFYISESRVQAATVSIPPRAEYVGPITEQGPEEPPVGVNEVIAVATMPDAVMVERVGEPHERWESLGVWKCTAYCKGSCCNGRNAGRTASGAPMVVGRTVAVGHLPFGTVLKINGTEYVVEDRGTPYGHIDVLYADHTTASNHGVQYKEVWIKR